MSQPEKTSEADLLTEKQAQEQELPMSLPWFRQMRVRGEGPPFIKVGSRVFYRRGELRAWIDSNTSEKKP